MAGTNKKTLAARKFHKPHPLKKNLTKLSTEYTDNNMTWISTNIFSITQKEQVREKEREEKENNNYS
jgi:hypothetical protein